MPEDRTERRLTTILAADVVGYSRLMGEDETGTLASLKVHRRKLFEPKTAEHHGRVVKLMGDGTLMEFGSVVDAVNFAVDVQRAIALRNADVTEDRRIVYRIGINIGDIIVEDEDIYGDGVNIAARLEELAQPGGICVARNVYNQVRDKLDLGFEDLGEVKVKNIARPIQVFRVVLDDKAVALVTPIVQAPVDVVRSRWPAISAGLAVTFLAIVAVVWWQPWAPPIETTSLETMAPPLSGKPSIAVLPFTNISDDPEQEYFADGMTEDLITDLAKISGLLVIARNSTFAYKGQSTDVREVAQQLGVRYVVEGSVRKAGGRIRINAQLIDAETGTHLWAERYDREATDVFSLQDEVRERIVAALRVTLTPAEEDRLARQLTHNAEAYDYYIRGLRQESFFTKEGNLESRRLFERALELDPTFATAMGKLATAHTLAAETGWSSTPEKSQETARLLAENAVALDGDLPQAHWAVARVYSRKRLFDGDRALASLRKAIALDPNYADGHALLATVLVFVGRAEEALGHIETAMRLNPHFPFWYYYSLGTSQFMLTRYDVAVESFEKAIERNSAWRDSHLHLVAAYGHLGMIDEAEWEMEELRMLGFEPTISNWKSRIQIEDPAYLARYFDGLRKAGVPEE
ncbi:MAG: adenylate/guanylate cyclase domain-containing protein [Gemmatimonadota bacterium]